MSTSDIRIRRKSRIIYGIVALFCVLFTIVYEKFSYGEFSVSMRCMFLFPLVGGLGMSLLLGKRKINMWSVRFWNSAIAVFTVGCLVHGIIAISGRSSAYDWYYWIAGILFVLGAIIIEGINIKKMNYRI